MLIRATGCTLALVIAAIIPAQVQARGSHSPAHYTHHLRVEGRGVRVSEQFRTYGSLGWTLEWKCDKAGNFEIHVNLEQRQTDKQGHYWTYYAKIFRAGPMQNHSGHGAHGGESLSDLERTYRLTIHTSEECQWGIIVSY